MNLTTQITYPVFQSRLKAKYIFSISFIVFAIANVVLDYLFTRFQNSSFYFSESLLFSSYWVLFLPLLLLFLDLTRKIQKFAYRLLLTSLIIVLHLLSYPALVWILSKTLYSHTFSYWQTFNFGLSAYFIKTVIVYGFSWIAFMLPDQKYPSANLFKGVKEKINNGEKFIRSILISDSNNKKLVLDVEDILYFSANSPYVNIYHFSKAYLHTGTLKSLEAQLDGNQFLRIHKSLVVNISKISTIQSRQNGDYDVTLSDDTILRVSRNYAKNFKLKFAERHQLGIK